METYPLPVVAIVHGHAIAGGNELALHCDFVVASSAANFGMSLAQIGLAPTWFLAKKLMEVAGPVATREILLLGDPLPATRMRRTRPVRRRRTCASTPPSSSREPRSTSRICGVLCARWLKKYGSSPRT